MGKRVVLLASRDAQSTRFVYNALTQAFDQVSILFEERVTRRMALLRRAKRIGYLAVFGQVLFVGIVVPILKRTSKRRFESIKIAYGLDEAPLAGAIYNAKSVNSHEARRTLRELQPDVIVVNGTRIIGKKTLSSIDVPIINMHAGITPLYRGVHGGYWALVENQPDLVGTTIHLIDEGIDTGHVINQVTFQVTKEDSFVTYPYLHVAAGLPSLIRVVDHYLKNERFENGIIDSQLPSKLRTHPTIWEYLYHRIGKGVR